MHDPDNLVDCRIVDNLHAIQHHLGTVRQTPGAVIPATTGNGQVLQSQRLRTESLSRTIIAIKDRLAAVSFHRNPAAAVYNDGAARQKRAVSPCCNTGIHGNGAAQSGCKYNLIHPADRALLTATV